MNFWEVREKGVEATDAALAPGLQMNRYREEASWSDFQAKVLLFRELKNTYRNFLNPPRKYQISPTPNRCVYIQPCIMVTRNYAKRRKEVSKNI